MDNAQLFEMDTAQLFEMDTAQLLDVKWVSVAEGRKRE